MENARKLFVFDWDNNVLTMDTKLIVTLDGNDVEISTAQFADLRKNGQLVLNDNSFLNFTDAVKDVFHNDVVNAIQQGSFAPSWAAFKKCLLHAEEFAIITARGHKAKTIKKVIRIIVEDYFCPTEKSIMLEQIKNKYNLTSIKSYISKCSAYCVNSDDFHEKFSTGRSMDVDSLKVIAMRDYLRKMKKRYKNEKFVVGMSDDDTLNVQSMVKYFESIKGDYHKMIVFDTSNESLTKIRIN